MTCPRTYNGGRWAGFKSRSSYSRTRFVPGGPKPGWCYRASSLRGIAPSTPSTPAARPNSQKCKLEGWTGCKCVHNSKWISPNRDTPGGHLAVECAQPDKKANAWHLMHPGRESGFAAGLWQGKSHPWSPPARTGWH